MDINDPLVSLFIPRAQCSRGMLHAARATLGSLPMVARALLKRAKKPMRIIVDSRATTGSTDCETRITLPRVPLPKTEADVESAIDMAALLYGLIHHEVGHCNHSDIDDARAARKGIEKDLLNIIEDVRMENAHIRDIPSSRAYLDAMNVVMNKKGQWAIVGEGDPPESVFINYVMGHLNAVYRHDPMSMQVHEQKSAQLESTFTPALRQKLDALLVRTETLQSCRESFELARDVVQLLQQEAQDAQQQDQQQSQQQSGQQQSGSGQGQPSNGSSNAGQNEAGDESDAGQGDSDEPSDDSEQSGQSGGDEGQQDGDDQEGEGNGAGTGSNSDASAGDNSDQGQDPSSGANKGQGGQGSDASSQSQPSNGNPQGNGQGSLSDRIKQVLSNQNGNQSGDKHQQAHELLQEIVQAVAQLAHEGLNLEEAIDALDAAQQLGGRSGESGELETGANHDLEAAHSASLSIRRKLLSELDARTNAEIHVGKRGRSLSSRHLDRVMTGDGRVFKTTVEGVAPDTAVMLVQDVSGSMSGRPVELASQALYASALAMDGIEGIDVAAMAFPGNGKILGFGESPRAHKQRFQLDSWGGTPMGDAVQVATQALLGQRNARRLMVVLTDGAPDSYPRAQAMIAAAEAAGIEVYGVGICTNVVQGLFTRWIEIYDINQLPTRIVSLIRDEVMLSIAA